MKARFTVHESTGEHYRMRGSNAVVEKEKQEVQNNGGKTKKCVVRDTKHDVLSTGWKKRLILTSGCV